MTSPLLHKGINDPENILWKRWSGARFENPPAETIEHDPLLSVPTQALLSYPVRVFVLSFDAASAGTNPGGLNQLTVKMMSELGVDVCQLSLVFNCACSLPLIDSAKMRYNT